MVDELVRTLGRPGRLSQVGVTRDRFREIAENAMHDRYIHTNPRPITSAEQVLEILELAA